VKDVTAATMDKVDETIADAVETLLENTAPPFSILRSATSPLKSGRNRVHHRATRKLRSRIRCLTMKRTTRMKNVNAENISTRSNQSDFSNAVISCLDVPMRPVSVSCVVDVERRVAVDEPKFPYYSIASINEAKIRNTHLAFVMIVQSVQVLLALSLSSVATPP
jgi:hypothetical protein